MYFFLFFLVLKVKVKQRATTSPPRLIRLRHPLLLELLKNKLGVCGAERQSGGGIETGRQSRSRSGGPMRRQDDDLHIFSKPPL